VTPDPYLSAHLSEDATANVDSNPVDPTPNPPALIPRKCPEAEGKLVTIEKVEYKLFCTLGHTQDNPNLGVSSATSFQQCMEQCCE
jgi:hypothetical protein